MKPRLVTVAHGTRDPDGSSLVASLVRRVGRRLPGVEVVGSYVELAEPRFAAVMEAAERPSVVVPLLLSTGYHVKHDLPCSASLSAFGVRMAPPLGPHPLLATAAAARLRAAGARDGDGVVLVAAGSRDPEARAQAVVAGRLLGREWTGPVRVAFLGGGGPCSAAVVAGLRAEGCARVAASPYLLAPGYFAAQVASSARALRVTMVADVLGGHRLVAELVVCRYLAAVSSAV